ncbi:MAG: DUF4494 domain-containing protein [Crocinitomicaceae bacterium]|nr:DUF4494 domain-containing protein [Crocinitomicaceae bacterium]
MNNWFTVKVKYTKQLENGDFKRVTEPYLLAAMTFTDAEARIYEELGAVIRGEFSVTTISRTDFHDIFHYDDSDTWYKCKITYEGATEDSDKPKKVTQNFLITAHSVKEAYERMQESLSTLMVDFMIPSITVSPIVDIFPYNEELDKEISRRPMEEDETVESVSGRKVFTAPGSDIDEDEEDEMEEGDSDFEDNYSDEDPA